MSRLTVYSPDLLEVMGLTKQLPIQVRLAQNSALSSTGTFAIRAMRRWIESAGEGTWEKSHSFTRAFRSNRQVGLRPGFKPHGSGQSRLFHRSLFGRTSPFETFGKFARYLVFNQQMMVGFSTQKKPFGFNRDLEQIMARAQQGETIQVTPKMRRLWASSGEFFLRKSTSTLRVPPRPIEKPVFDRIKGTLPTLFDRRFRASLARKSKLADFEFLGGIGVEKE